MTVIKRVLLLTIVTCIACICDFAFAQQALQVRVKIGPGTLEKKVSGRVLVFFSKRNRSPVTGPNWFAPEPFYGIDVKNVEPADSIVIDDSAAGFPVPLSRLESGVYNVQAILDHDFYFANHNHGAGNVVSEPKRITIDADTRGPIDIELTRLVESQKIDETKWFKVVSRTSRRLTNFHGRKVIERAAVVLPPSYYEQPKRRYPVYYDVSGYGGTLFQLQFQWAAGQPGPEEGETEFIRVYLTGQCKWGHHVYANSATNGPRGDALISEMIPKIDKSFRTIAEPTARFVGGHSSGGWSALWLQVRYPEIFGGVWSTAPDPVDFRDWQGTNLYDANGASVFVDENGNRRPVARQGDQRVWYDTFCKMDDVLGRGGQLRSFEAVFSPKAEDGLPAKCWDRKTGKIDPKIVEHWRQFDISLLLEENWAVLEPKLAGKLHVYMGDMDTFYLDGAARLLGERLKKLGSDAVVELFPDKDHMSLLSDDLQKRIRREMTEAFHKHHPQAAGSNK